MFARSQEYGRARRPRHPLLWSAAVLGALLTACGDEPPPTAAGPLPDPGPSPLELELDEQLSHDFSVNGFTGRVEERFAEMLGRPVDAELAETGRLLFFDPILSITGDNSCAGCHGPNVAFNDSKSIAVGVGNNGVVGPGRTGPHNIRRAPTILNAAFYPRLMWDGRFFANSVDPFNNAFGFVFPEPEGETLSHMEHLLGAQAFTPVVNRSEMAGFDFVGTNDDMRAVVTARVDSIAEYRSRFAEVFDEVAAGGALRYEHIAAALAEFGFTLIRADSPVDRYARGDLDALTLEEKQGGRIFFQRRGSCFECHATLGYANEMFSDFESHNLAVPQVVPFETNADFDGPGRNEDFGLERVTGDPDDRYKFRTTPLRNVAYQPTFMHNGAFVCLEEAIRHHQRMYESLETYTTARLDPSLRAPLGPTEPMVELAHEFSRQPVEMSDEELDQVAAFVRALSDPDASPEALRHLVPASVPSGLPVHEFDFDLVPASCN
jgi:cytochrome c peroxidase